MKLWQITLLRYSSIAFGIAVGVTITVAALIWYSERPKPWDESSITCEGSEANPYDNNLRDVDFHTSGFELKFTLVNNTNADYTFPDDAKFLERRRDTKALEEFNGKVPQPVLVPAHERAQLTVNLDYSCGVLKADGTPAQDRADTVCYNDAFGSASGIVLLDSGHKVRLNLAVPKLKSFRN